MMRRLALDSVVRARRVACRACGDPLSFVGENYFPIRDAARLTRDLNRVAYGLNKLRGHHYGNYWLVDQEYTIYREHIY